MHACCILIGLFDCVRGERAVFQEPRDIVFADCSRTADEKKRDEEEIKKIVEVGIRKEKDMRRNLNPRHSRFVGSYVVRGVKAVNQENDLVVQKLVL